MLKTQVDSIGDVVLVASPGFVFLLAGILLGCWWGIRHGAKETYYVAAALRQLSGTERETFKQLAYEAVVGELGPVPVTNEWREFFRTLRSPRVVATASLTFAAFVAAGILIITDIGKKAAWETAREEIEAGVRAAYKFNWSGINEALERTNIAITVAPSLADAHAARALVAFLVFRANFSVPSLPSRVAQRQASTFSSKALRLDPENARALSVKSYLLAYDKKYTEAVATVERATRLDPDSGEAWLILADILNIAGQPKRARDAVVKASELGVDFTFPSFSTVVAASAYFNTGEFCALIEMLEPMRGTLPNSQRIYLAAAYANVGQLAEAHQEIRAIAPFGASRSSINLQWIKAERAHFRDQSSVERLVETLREIGISRWPYGFDERLYERVKEPLLGSLLRGKTIHLRWWQGDVSTIALSEKGRYYWKSRGLEIKGEYSVKNDMLCIRDDYVPWGRDLCGSVFRNPEGLRETYDEYFWVSPFWANPFSIEAQQH